LRSTTRIFPESTIAFEPGGCNVSLQAARIRDLAIPLEVKQVERERRNRRHLLKRRQDRRSPDERRGMWRHSHGVVRVSGTHRGKVTGEHHRRVPLCDCAQRRRIGRRQFRGARWWSAGSPRRTGLRARSRIRFDKASSPLLESVLAHITPRA
jgi:hypothetical protein